MRATYFTLDHNQINDQACENLAQAQWKNLQTLNLS